MGHNEDGAVLDIYNSYMIHARIQISASEPAVEFTALCYAGELCGNAVGFNLHTGILSTMNDVFPKNINTSAVRELYCMVYDCYSTHFIYKCYNCKNCK